MKLYRTRWLLPLIAALLLTLMVGCAQPAPTPVPPQPTAVPTEAPAVSEPTEAPAAEAAVLTVNGTVLSEADIKALPEIEAVAQNSSGADETYKGYSILALLDKLGVTGGTLTLVADDGYQVEVAMADLTEECILRFRTNGGLSSTMPGLDKSANVKGVVELVVTGEAVVAEPAEAQELLLATTTSTENSGLLAYLLPDFEKKYNATVSVIAVGTGQALALGEDGNADVLLVHARALEDAFMADGHGTRREDVMYNDFVIVGPESDPAGIKGMSKAPKALAKMAEAKAAFVSRGDESGTHTKEKALWAEAGVEPAGDWYVSAGQGMGAVLTMADEQQAYALTDRATYLALTLEGTELVILVEGDPILFNPYGVMTVNPNKGDHIKADLANAFVDWLISVDAQKMISEFGVAEFGAPLFTPDSQPWRDSQAASSAQPVGDAAVTVAGKAFSMAELEALGVVTQEVENTKGEMAQYSGVSLKALLDAAGVKGDKISLVADDGYGAEVALADITDACMLSFRSQGGLSSVMPGMAGSTWVKGVVEIKALAPKAPAAEAVVTIANMPFSMADLEALGVVTREVENSKGEKAEYTGVSLQKLLNAAGVKADSITLVADDGFSAEVALADVNDACMLSFRSKGGLSAVMPGSSGSAWVKGVVQIKAAAGADDGPVSVVDTLGRTVDLDTIPSRIVTPGKGAWMVGHPLYLFSEAQGRVAAMEARRGTVSNFLDCIVPGFSGLQHLEMNSGPEAIVPLEPDCILLKSYSQESLGKPLEDLGLPVIYLDLETPAKFYDDMRSIGQLFNDTARADEVVAYYQGKVEMISKAVDGLDKPSVLLIQYSNVAEDLVAEVPPMGWMQTIIVETAGGEPVWADAATSGGWTGVNFEQIAAWDPDVIMLVVFRADPEPVMAELKADPKWSALAAVANDQFYAFPGDHYGWDVPDPRWILGATWAAKTLHPEALADVDMMAEVSQFYGEMYGMEAAAIDECIVPYLTGDIQ